MKYEDIKILITARNCGFFSFFLQVINTLYVVDDLNFKIDVDTSKGEPFAYNVNNKDIWNIFFEKLTNYNEHNIKQIYEINNYYPQKQLNILFNCSRKNKLFKNNIEIPFNGTHTIEHRKLMFHCIQKYIQLKRPYLDEINNFTLDNFTNKYVIGVHFRGTDARNSPRRSVPEYTIYLNYIEKELSIIDNIDYIIYVASDEQNFIDFLKQKFNTISINCLRTTNNDENNERMFDGWDCPKFCVDSPYEATKGVIYDYNLLSKCNSIIHCGGSVPLSAIFSNLNIKNIPIEKYGYRYKSHLNNSKDDL